MAGNQVLVQSAVHPYQGALRKKRRMIALLFALTAVMSFVAMNPGAVNLSLSMILKGVWGFGTLTTSVRP